MKTGINVLFSTTRDISYRFSSFPLSVLPSPQQSESYSENFPKLPLLVQSRFRGDIITWL